MDVPVPINDAVAEEIDGDAEEDEERAAALTSRREPVDAGVDGEEEPAAQDEREDGYPRLVDGEGFGDERPGRDAECLRHHAAAKVGEGRKGRRARGR